MFVVKPVCQFCCIFPEFIEDLWLLGYDAMWSGRSSLTFWRNILPPFLGLKNTRARIQQELGSKQNSVVFCLPPAFLVSCMCCSLILKMGTGWFSDTLVNYQTK
jgi:hypothetical protein